MRTSSIRKLKAPPGKPGQAGSLAQSICRSHVMSSLRNHGTDHKAPALRKRHYDLWGRFVLRRVSPGRREHSFSPAAVEFTRVKFRLKGKQRHSCSGLADWSIGGEGNPLRRRRAVRFTIALRSSARDGALCSARMAKLADAADLKSAGRKAVGVQVPLRAPIRINGLQEKSFITK